jgi:hypothetical protein
MVNQFPLNNVARQLPLRPAFAVSVAGAGPCRKEMYQTNRINLGE